MEQRILHHERVTGPGAEPEQWLLVLHGIYGMGRNWGSIARRVVRARPGWGAVLVDLREHGGSRGFPPPHTLEAAADDLAALAGELGASAAAVLGHSFGGKVAMMYARRHGASLRQLWVADSTPAARRPGGAAADMLAVVRRVPGPFGSRTDAVDALVAEGVARPVAQWMSTNVGEEGGAYRWLLDFDAMEALLDDFFRTDLWDVVEDPPGALELHFLQASRSDVLDADAAARIEAAGRATGRVALHRVEGGHWLNADNPDALVSLLEERLPGDGG